MDCHCLFGIDGDERRRKGLQRSCTWAPISWAGAHEPNGTVCQKTDLQWNQNHSSHHNIKCQVHPGMFFFHHVQVMYTTLKVELQDLADFRVSLTGLKSVDQRTCLNSSKDREQLNTLLSILFMMLI